VEAFARVALLFFGALLLLQVLGVGGQGVARTPGEAWGRVRAWLAAKFIGGERRA
jgi:hypothetical protein